MVTEVPQPSDPMEHVIDEAVHKELGDSLVRVVTTASSLEAEQESGGSPRCQEAMGDTTAQTRFESISKLFNDSLLARVLDLENTKITQANVIDSLKMRVKKLEKRNRIEDIDQDENITLVNVQADAEMFDVEKDLDGGEMFVKQEVVANKEKIDEVTLS
nr:hypothetical protein [Tanacetum cinerariifolium]